MVASLSLAGWSLLVAVFGLAIATFTFLTNRSAIHREQVDRARAIDDAWAREWASQRPVVYHVLDRVSSNPSLPLKNGGRGPALNVVGELEIRSDESLGTGTWRVVAGTIAAGDVVKGMLSSGVAPPWHAMSGTLRYSDLAGGKYASPFSFSYGPDGQLELVIGEQEHRTPLEAKEQEPS